MIITIQGVITVAAVVTAVSTIVGILLAIYRWFLKQNDHDAKYFVPHEVEA